MIRILDTNVLINHWHRLGRKRPTMSDIRAHAKELIDVEGTSWIVSPVLIEFLAGARTGEELKLYKAYLEPFDILDKGDIPRQDWEEAKRLAQWVRTKGRRRKLGDCLFQAIAKRLNAEPVTRDTDFKWRVPPS